MQSPSIDPVSVAIAVVGTLAGPEIAAYAGPYSVIVFAWLGGVLIGFYRRDVTSRISAAAFVAVTFCMTIGFTTAFAHILAQWISFTVKVEATTLLFPVAFLIPAIGESWLRIGKWAASVVASRFSKGAP